MKQNPKVSVIMSVYNGEKYLREAVDSILTQTFTDFEFIIVNDGSKDRTQEILKSYADPRIHLYHQENTGLTKSLNKALKLSRGEYIARMDADDISLPERFETQIKHFQVDPSLTLCASRYQVIDENGNFSGRIQPFASKKMINWHLLSWYLLFRNRICHSSVMVKKVDLLKLNGYAEWAKRTQDFELWTRMSLKYNMIIIPEVFIYWRYHQSGICQSYSDEQRQTRYKIFHRLDEHLTGLKINKDVSIYLRAIFNQHFEIKPNFELNPYTIDALKLLSQFKTSFIKNYQPDLETQLEIIKTVQDVYIQLIIISIRRFSFSSFKLALYIFCTYPTPSIKEVVRLSFRLIEKILKPSHQKAIQVI